MLYYPHPSTTIYLTGLPAQVNVVAMPQLNPTAQGDLRSNVDYVSFYAVNSETSRDCIAYVPVYTCTLTFNQPGTYTVRAATKVMGKGFVPSNYYGTIVVSP